MHEFSDSMAKDNVSATFIEAISFFWRCDRMKTFHNWPFKATDKCNSENMAAAGFYSIGDYNEPDLVECFICGKQLNGWEPHDDPWSEHVKHQSTCPFVKLKKQNEEEWTIDELYDLYKQRKIREHLQDLNKFINKLKDAATQWKNELPAAYQMSLKNKKNTD